MSKSEQVVSLEQVLCNLSAHLDLLAGQVFEVEHALGDMLKTRRHEDDLSITKFQTLDFARQSLEDCALLLHFLGVNSVSQSSKLKYSCLQEKLKLDATKSLFLKRPSGNDDSNKVSGEMDLF